MQDAILINVLGIPGKFFLVCAHLGPPSSPDVSISAHDFKLADVVQRLVRFASILDQMSTNMEITDIEAQTRKITYELSVRLRADRKECRDDEQKRG